MKIHVFILDIHPTNLWLNYSSGLVIKHNAQFKFYIINVLGLFMGVTL